MPERSVVVTTELQRAIRRDVLRYSLTQPSGLVSVIVMPIAVFVIVLTGGDLGIALRLTIAVIAVAVLLAILIGGTWRRMSRAVAALFPIGSTVTASAEQDALRVVLAGGDGRSGWASYSSMRVLPATVLLRRRDTRVTSIVPRTLFAADELPVIRDRIVQR